jgi:SRSO17 transposase
VGVSLGYASRKGYTLLDGQLFVPEAWFDDAQAAKRDQTGMPAELAFLTKPQIALLLLERALARGGLGARWLAADGLW